MSDKDRCEFTLGECIVIAVLVAFVTYLLTWAVFSVRVSLDRKLPLEIWIEEDARLYLHPERSVPLVKKKGAPGL